MRFYNELDIIFNNAVHVELFVGLEVLLINITSITILQLYIL